MPPKREKSLNFRVTDEEYELFKDLADALDMSFSDFVRRATKLGAAQLIAFPDLRPLEPDCTELMKLSK